MLVIVDGHLPAFSPLLRNRDGTAARVCLDRHGGLVLVADVGDYLGVNERQEGQ